MVDTLKYGYILCFILWTNISFAQLSPGELSAAHAHLEGLKNCTECHVLKEKETMSKCLSCHKEIQQLLDQNRGYHASSDAKDKKCAECHGEHFGRNFEITRFNEKEFDHDLAGYKLEGKHAQIDCNDCHKTELIESKISQKKGETFLGLGTECLSCHDDFHQNTLSNDCVSCHNQNAFRPASGFNHDRTKFSLVGKHQNLDCAKCHQITQKNGRDFQEFAGVNFGKCTDCHEDVHNNKFGSDCRKCHDEFSFNEVKSLSSFNHEKTDFPLRGMHRVVDCKTCHTKNYTQAIKHNLCADCHEDYHENQFMKNSVSPDCSECHSVERFTPSDYTFETHNQTDFPLEGAHMATPCFVCHQQENKWNFADLGKDCISCHENIHENYLAKKYLPENNCKSCHSVSVWNEIQFDHNQTNFELQGKHQQVTCRNCHFSESENDGFTQQFSELANSCENCHDDVHFKQFLNENKNDCERCHTFNNWQAEKFNHDNARFVLDGEHVGLECVECHKPTDGLIENYIVYKFEEITCASCH